MQRVLIVGCLLLMVGVANAVPTTVEDTISTAPTFDMTHWVYQGSLSWLHTVDYGAPPVPGATLDLLSASLTIRAYSVEETMGVTVDGNPAGNLATGQPMQWLETTFTAPDAALDALLMDGQLAVVLTPTGDLGESYQLDWSKLSVTYDWLLPPPPDPPKPVVPAPAGLVLAGIGTAVIGWLRRHQCL